VDERTSSYSGTGRFRECSNIGARRASARLIMRSARRHRKSRMHAVDGSAAVAQTTSYDAITGEHAPCDRAPWRCFECCCSSAAPVSGGFVDFNNWKGEGEGVGEVRMESASASNLSVNSLNRVKCTCAEEILHSFVYT
jgi:hypothetical protein